MNSHSNFKKALKTSLLSTVTLRPVRAVNLSFRLFYVIPLSSVSWRVFIALVRQISKNDSVCTIRATDLQTCRFNVVFNHASNG